MQAVCSPLDTSQLLRDILKNKEQHLESSSSSINNSDSNSTNSSSSSNSILIKENSILPVARGCDSEMISPLLHSKSSDMAYTDRGGQDNDVDQDNDGNATTVSNSNVSHNSSFSGKDRSRMDFEDADDDEDRSQDLSLSRRKATTCNDDEDDNNSADRRILKLPVSSSPAGESETAASSSEWESKEAKRAHVENILTNMRQSPPPSALAGSEDASGDPSPTGSVGKRQKRKQPQPQQHDTSVSSIEDQLQYQGDQKRSRRDRGQTSPAPNVPLDASNKSYMVGGGAVDGFSVNGDLDEPIVDDSDTDVDDSADDLAKPYSGHNATDINVEKRGGVDHILSGLQALPAMSNGCPAQASPSGESSKKQKRKQTQPQQHENSTVSGSREDRRQKLDDNHNKSINMGHFFGLKPGSLPEGSVLNSTHMTPDHGMANLMGADALLRKSLFRGMGERDFIPPYHGGFDPNLYRDNLFRQSLFGLRPELDPMAAFRNLPKNVHGFSDHLLSSDENAKLPSAAELVKIASVLKSELKQAVNKAIDNAVSKVLNEKQVSTTNADRSAHISNSGQEHQNQPQQQSHIDRQNPSRPKSVTSPKLLPNFLLPHHPLHHNLQHPQQHQAPHQHPSHPHQQVHQLPQRSSPTLSTNPSSELESAKENVDSAAANAGSSAQQAEKKPELIVPFSDHLHILERFGNRLHQQQQQHPLHHPQQPQDQEKLSAFDPVTRAEREGEAHQHQLITPHTGPAMTFHPHFPYYLPAHALPPGLYPGMGGNGAEPEQTEALPLIVSTPKKKRTKVTDTRLSSPRGNTTTTSSASTTPNNIPGSNSQTNGSNNNNCAAANNNNNNTNNNNNNTKSSLLQDNTSSSSMDNMDSLAQRHLAAAAAAAAAASSFPHFLPPVLPTSVAITNPSLSHSDLLTLRLREAGFPDARIPSPSDHGRVSSPRSPNDSPHYMSKLELFERSALSMPGDHLMDMAGPGAPHPISFSKRASNIVMVD